MRFYDVTLFMLIVSVFGAVWFGTYANNFGYGTDTIYFGSPEDVSEEDLIDSVKEDGLDTSVTADDPVTNALGWAYKFVVTKFNPITNFFEKYVLWIYWVLALMGIPSELALAITTIFYFVEGIGIFQIITGRSFKEAE